MKMTRKLLVIVCLINSNCCLVTNNTNFCSQDISEVFYKAPIVILARVKKISFVKSGVLLELRTSKVLKSSPGSPIKPKNKIKLRHGKKFCKKIKERKKFIFSLHFTNGKYQLVGRPVGANKKVKRICQKMFCSYCGGGPKLKQISQKSTVKLSRWKHLSCRLSSGHQPTVTFTWIFKGKRVGRGRNFKIKTRRTGSVLNVKGRPDTAGVYTCVANSLAGNESISTTLYVHGTSGSVCPAFCLNHGRCSIAKLGTGELQPLCSCSQGYTGARCELKHVTGMFTSDIVIIVILLVFFGVVIFLIYILFNKFKLMQKEIQEKVREGSSPIKHLNQSISLDDTPTKMNNGGAELQNVSVTKSASEPGMQSMCPMIQPLLNTSHACSSQSSNISSASLRSRRAAVPENLTINLPLVKKKSITKGTVNLLPVLNNNDSSTPNPSPLYAEPYDSAARACIHGHGDRNSTFSDGCKVCVKDAEQIVNHCHAWSTEKLAKPDSI